MGVNISYMGTKRDLASAVADVVGLAKPGILLDAFSGMCSVGERVAPSRQIWSNDVQLFAAEVGRALFTCKDEPYSAIRAADLLFDRFENHRLKLLDVCRASVKAEDSLLSSENFVVFSKRWARLSKALASDVARLRTKRATLFSRIYSNNYLGVRQAIEADAIRRAIFVNHRVGQNSNDHKRWLMIALGRALLKVANSTGHFAQYLKPKQTTYKRYSNQRRRSLWSEWLFSIGELQAVGSEDWRRKNRGFNEDSLLLIPKLASQKDRPTVVYADPPYTEDQYSRYYHLFETLMLYDYPKVTGVGLYRPSRFQTPFSIKSKVCAALDSLVSATAEIGADMILSYPSNGLVIQAGADPGDILRAHFRNVKCCRSLAYSHSTFGASKGAAHAAVTERIYLARL